MIVHLVLEEDPYETRVGDGYFAYLVAAFVNRAALETWLASAPSGPIYHRREGALERTPGASWRLDVTLREGERANADDVARLLGFAR